MRINDQGLIDFSDVEGFEFDLSEFAVDDNQLHEEACEAPLKIAKLGIMLGKATITQRDARLTRNIVCASIAESMRADNPKVSQAAIDAATPANPEYQEAERHLTQAEASLVTLDALLKAAVQRRAIIDTLHTMNRSTSNHE